MKGRKGKLIQTAVVVKGRDVTWCDAKRATGFQVKLDNGMCFIPSQTQLN